MRLGILVVGVDKPQKSIMLWQKSGPVLRIKNLLKNNMVGKRGGTEHHTATLQGFAVKSQNTHELQAREIFLFHDIIGDSWI